MWVVKVLDRPEKQLGKLQKKQQRIIRTAIDRMEDDPFQGDVKALQGKWKGFYRKVAGTHRIIFSADRSALSVFIERIEPRTDNTYR